MGFKYIPGGGTGLAFNTGLMSSWPFPFPGFLLSEIVGVGTEL
jgi:hypothetical protein